VTTALLTDRYELTMVQAALRSGKAERQTVFEVFTRSLPAGRRFGVLAGNGRLLEAVQKFRFEKEEIAFLIKNEIVDESTAVWLQNFRFKGNIYGYQEGELFFANSPVLRVEGSFAEAVILETVILSILNYDSAVASAAARMRYAAGSRYLAEMGARRANEHAAVAAARAAYIVGFDATSNLEAGRSWGIPTMGTSAHSFTLLHDSEAEAFRSQIESMGNETTLLVDTYDIEPAVKEAVRLTDGKIAAVRIDSGDLSMAAGKVRQLLDSLGATETKIVVTSDLDEYTIAALAAAPVDRYGVGTSLVTGSGHPTVGFVYKLVAHSDGDGWVDVAKTSTSKANRGGKKFASRKIQDDIAIAELVGGESQGRPLQVQLVADGECFTDAMGPEGVFAARNHHAMAISELNASGFRLSNGDPAIPTYFV
jgi:nicotinate phosphoribosyltransferase|tara:strand:+ start:63 stop:1334 length:1272 start_codon:yes stop_codon:yes gene_type:complete